MFYCIKVSQLRFTFVLYVDIYMADWTGSVSFHAFIGCGKMDSSKDVLDALIW